MDRNNYHDFDGEDDEIRRQLREDAAEEEGLSSMEYKASQLEWLASRMAPGAVKAEQLRAEAAELRADAAKMRAMVEDIGKSYTPPTPEERADAETHTAAVSKEFMLEHRRNTRYGKPDPRFTNSHGESTVQKITGKEKIWRVYVRPGVSTSTKPHWLKASEPGAIVYDVRARDEKHARRLVKLNLRAKGPRMPGIRRKRKVKASI